MSKDRNNVETENRIGANWRWQACIFGLADGT